MKSQIQNIPVKLDDARLKLRSPGVWGGMVVEYFETKEKLDMRPLYEGLPDNKSPARSWGYILKGALNVEYSDGSKERITAGDIYYVPKGHTGWFDAGSALIIFSPEAEHKVVEEHLAKKL